MHLLAFKHVIHLTAMYATPICGGIALIKGGKPERFGAAVYIGALLLTDLFFAIGSHPGAVGAAATATFKSGYTDPTTAANIDLVSTLLVSGFFLYLAIRYGSLWLAAAMIIDASELYFARLYIDSGFSTFPTYAIELNLICTLVLTTLAVAALWSWRDRVVKRRTDAKRAELTARRRAEQERRFQAMFEHRSPPPPLAPPSPGRVARLTIEPPPI
jgi:hypothetical protein